MCKLERILFVKCTRPVWKVSSHKTVDWQWLEIFLDRFIIIVSNKIMSLGKILKKILLVSSLTT